MYDPHSWRDEEGWSRLSKIRPYLLHNLCLNMFINNNYIIHYVTLIFVIKYILCTIYVWMCFLTMFIEPTCPAKIRTLHEGPNSLMKIPRPQLSIVSIDNFNPVRAKCPTVTWTVHGLSTLLPDVTRPGDPVEVSSTVSCSRVNDQKCLVRLSFSVHPLTGPANRLRF